MSSRSQKAKKRRLSKQSKEIPVPRAKPQSLAAPIPKAGQRFFDFIEHPLFLAAFAIIGGTVGLILYTPALLICEICILLALHRSNILQGQGKLFAVTTYMIVFLLSTPLLLGVGVWVKEPVREYLHIASSGKPQIKLPGGNVPAAAASNPIPLPGGFFNSPASSPMAPSPATNVATPKPSGNQPEADSIEAALMREMRERLTRDAGDPQKISLDVQWMRDQFELGWAQEPPALARKHREETDETARLILAAASNRAAVLELVPRITIDK
jgi:hypothetical protein